MADYNSAYTGVQIDAGIAKTAHLTVTQAVDLDTLESNVATNNAKTGVTTEISNLVEDTTPQLGGDLDLNGKAIPLAYNAQTGTTYTAVLGDAEKIISMNNASANTLTIPANASVAYPVGTKLNFLQLGAGATTIAITSDTLNVNANLTLVLNGQYAMATAVKVTSTTWVLFGNLVAS
jgi:hypothetical protein